jgi:hypothetical protein
VAALGIADDRQAARDRLAAAQPAGAQVGRAARRQRRDRRRQAFAAVGVERRRFDVHHDVAGERDEADAVVGAQAGDHLGGRGARRVEALAAHRARGVEHQRHVDRQARAGRRGRRRRRGDAGHEVADGSAADRDEGAIDGEREARRGSGRIGRRQVEQAHRGAPWVSRRRSASPMRCRCASSSSP